MKKYLLPLLVSCTLILTGISVLASPVEISMEPEVQSGQLYSAMKFNLTIVNNQDFSDIFQIVFSGDHLEWNMPGLIAKTLNAHSSEDIGVVFYPTGSNKGKFEFTVSVNSFKNPNVKASTKFLIEIPYDFTVKTLSSSVSDNTVNFDAIIQTPEEKTLQGTFDLKDSSGKIIGSVPFTETIKGEKKITKSFTPKERLLAGTYTSSVSVGNDIIVYYTFDIQPVRSISQKVEETSSGFSKDVTIAITNEGNVIERDYSFQQKIPIDPMTGMMTRPADNCREEEGVMVCNYLVEEIRPGATAHVSYVVSYWPAFNGYIILTVIVISLIMFSFLKATTPRIFKHHSKKGEDRHNIFIQVKNPFFHKLNDVVVRDWVSPLAQVIQEEIESTKPVMRRLEDGTELIWKLGEMKPREERILQYKVRSLIHGSLKMPGAKLKFSAGKGEKKLKISSNSVTLS
ncbi:MAG: hypothetical protein NTY20_00350 [Candidatus Aenigmarchaeota archaeon]|nr:hypothetical protein [Candidatus Aenigmarchaeota archaeon]